MKIVNSSEVEWQQAVDRGRFQGRRKALGGEKAACGLWELPPGARSWPLHLHHITEEALFVISGRAQVRTPEGEHPIGPGDFVSFPPGGPAHQLVNDGDEPLVYLGISAGVGVDIIEYPDSGKVGSMVGKWPDVKRFMFRGDTQVDYWEGEE
jgi:uncharacterized cupin superfamily protein